MCYERNSFRLHIGHARAGLLLATADDGDDKDRLRTCLRSALFQLCH